KRSDAEHTTRVLAYASYYDLDLFSNFTYFLEHGAAGDQFEQVDRRWTTGLAARSEWSSQWAGRDLETRIGLQLRNDSVRNGLFGARGGERQETRGRDRVQVTSASPYLESQIQWLDWFRSIAGVRFDAYRFETHDQLGPNSGTRSDHRTSPKLSLV